MNDEEKLWIENIEDLYLTWCAKEVIFKIYSEGELDFKKNIFIRKNKNHFSYEGNVIKNDVMKNYKLLYMLLENNLILVWGIEN